jgi:hypothetical protein
MVMPSAGHILAAALLGEIGRQSTFKPFGVTTPTGSRATFSSTGNLDTMLSPTEQALQEQMLGFGTRAFQFLDDPAAREAEQGSDYWHANSRPKSTSSA